MQLEVLETINLLLSISWKSSLETLVSAVEQYESGREGYLEGFRMGRLIANFFNSGY